MEALTLILGLRIAQGLGMHSITIVSDPLKIVQVILHPSEYRASGAIVTHDFQKMMIFLAGRRLITVHEKLMYMFMSLLAFALVLLRGLRSVA